MTTKTSTIFLLLILCVIGASILAPKFAIAQDNTVEPEADQLLRKMSDYLSSIEQFTFQGAVTIDAVLFSGQKIQNNGMIDASDKCSLKLRII